MTLYVGHLQFIDSKNCFLYLSPFLFEKLSNLCSNGVRVSRENGPEQFYFSIYPYPCKILSDSFVGLSSSFCRNLNLHVGEGVILCPLPSIASVKKIHAIPSSGDDLEILESVAGLVEASLLSQLRVVWPKQIFTVWVSASITISLLVDSLEPSLVYGRLDENSEIVIGDVKKESRGKQDDFENNIDSSSPSKFIAEADFDRLHPTDLEIYPNDEVTICRIVTVEPLWFSKVCSKLTSFNDHPYQGYVWSKGCPSFIIDKIKEEPSTIWRVDHVECDSNTPPDSRVRLAVHIIIIEEDPPNLVKDVGKFKSLFVSAYALNQINLPVGSKVILKPLDFPSSLKGLLVSINEETKSCDWCSNVSDKLFHKLTRVCIHSGPCLLNTDSLYPLNDDKDNCSKNHLARLTLRPLNLKYAFVSMASLRNLSINLTEYDKDSESKAVDDIPSKLEMHIQKPVKDYLSRISQLLIGEIAAAIEFSLGLDSGLICSWIHPIDNILITGKTGSGKTYMVDLFVNKVTCPPFYIHVSFLDCKSIKGKRLEAVTKILKELLNQCKMCQPSILVLDDIDSIGSNSKEDHERTEASLHSLRLCHKIKSMIENVQRDNQIIILACSQTTSNLNEVIYSKRGNSLFTSVINIPELEKNDRMEMIKNLLVERCNLSSSKHLDLERFAVATDGFTPVHLVKFVERIIFQSFQRSAGQAAGLEENIIVSIDDVETAYKSLSEDVNKSLNVTKAKGLGLSSMGGLAKAKEALVEIVLWPILFSEVMSQCPLKRQTGILLYGAPGTGKTMLARAIAAETNLNFILVKGPELMSKYIGQSEEGVRKVFENAKSAKPSLLFFDEFESLAPRRGAEQSGVSDRVVNQLLTALDGVEPLNGVIVMAASSCPVMIDPAILRPGRIGYHVRLDIPDQEERLEILDKICCGIPLSPQVDLSVIASKTHGYTGADLKGLITSAHINATDVSLPAGNDPTVSSEIFQAGGSTNVNINRNAVEISDRDLDLALQQTKPSLSPKDVKRYYAMFEEFENGGRIGLDKQKVTFA